MTQEFKHILVPVDFSEDAEKALEAALTVFGGNADQITLLTICESMSNRHAEMVAEIDEMMMKSIHEELNAFLKKYEGRHKNLKGFVKRGNPSNQILNYAKEIKADLIVMGSQGRNALARVFFGGTTYQVSRKAHCSVMVIRT
jgi:nucleotide-binding universal stress UspA family protein